VYLRIYIRGFINPHSNNITIKDVFEGFHTMTHVYCNLVFEIEEYQRSVLRVSGFLEGIDHRASQTRLESISTSCHCMSY